MEFPALRRLKIWPVWWYTPVSSEPRRWRQEDCLELEASLGYLVSKPTKQKINQRFEPSGRCFSFSMPPCCTKWRKVRLLEQQ